MPAANNTKLSNALIIIFRVLMFFYVSVKALAELDNKTMWHLFIGIIVH